MKLYNSLTRKIEEFEPINPPNVGIYTCGPTVYNYTHIGHLRKYINDDILVRALRSEGYNVRHVMNITDVGHLTGDTDAGEDKLEEGAKRFGKSVLEVARFFEDDFWKSLKKVNVLKPDTAARATEHIEDQIALIEELIKKGFTYETDQAIYFDVLKFPNYTKLSGQDLSEKIEGAREGVVVDPQKRNPADFALWFFTRGRFKNHTLRWESPWPARQVYAERSRSAQGKEEGFPGWHIECSAMSMKYLGLSFDIHTGGIDHIPVHHTNEIAQSEAATGKQFVKYWVHHAFLSVEDEKMSKSLGNIYRISDLIKKKFSPLSFRYLTFQTHYRSQMNFTWKALSSAQDALDRLYHLAADLTTPKIGCAEFEQKFQEAIENDLNMPKALSIMWEMLRSKYPKEARAKTLYKMDEILGLSIQENAELIASVPSKVLDLIKKRDALRKKRKFNESDKIRKEIEQMGYIVSDNKKETNILRKL